MQSTLICKGGQNQEIMKPVIFFWTPYRSILKLGGETNLGISKLKLWLQVIMIPWKQVSLQTLCKLCVSCNNWRSSQKKAERRRIQCGFFLVEKLDKMSVGEKKGQPEYKARTAFVLNTNVGLANLITKSNLETPWKLSSQRMTWKLYSVIRINYQDAQATNKFFNSMWRILSEAKVETN